MRKLKDSILKLHQEGKNYNQIAAELNCSKGVISYHLGQGQKQKTDIRRDKYRSKCHPFVRKLDNFKQNKLSTNILYNPISNISKLLKAKLETFFRNRKTKMYTKPEFTIDDVIQKFGPNPRCYLTGQLIDIYKPSTYEFDHIIPVSRGGNNSLDNLGICTKEANRAKNTMTHVEFVEFCKLVYQHNQ
jgi:5-methylcytosine-specific restriction endonuclease McrA